MVELGIDEMTMVLQLPSEYKELLESNEWSYLAELIIKRFVEKAKIEEVLGLQDCEIRPPQGYNIAYKYGNHNFYFAIAYHLVQMSMGVAIKFSAKALDYYCEQSSLHVYEFLRIIQDDFYSVRLSRVDLVADFIDEDLDVTAIYQDMMDCKVGIFRKQVKKKTGEEYYRKCEMQYSGFLKEKEVPTIYIGSCMSNARLRIYDKKREQIEQTGTKLEKAKNCRNWVRFESVYRHEFAYQITDELLHINNDIEYGNLIAWTIVQKFHFMYVTNGVVDCKTEYTEKLIEYVNGKNFMLKSPVSRNYDISNSVKYLIYGSGAVSTLYKIKCIWGDDGVHEVFSIIEDYLKTWTPNDDCRYWLSRNKNDYIKRYPDIREFLDKNFVVVCPNL